MSVSGIENRREFTKRIFGTAISVFLLESLFGCMGPSEKSFSHANRIVAPKAADQLNHWAIRLEEYCRDLNSKRLEPAEWQQHLARLFAQIELQELLQFIDFEKLSENLQLPDLGVSTRTVWFPGINGLPAKTVFNKKIFGMRQGRSIIPHGHSNMASGHLVLRGKLYLRQYDRLRLTRDEIEIVPTIAESIGAGRFSSISDEKNNAHWFVAEKGPAYTFDLIMLDLNDNNYDIHNMDIDAASKTSRGVLRVPLIPVDKALAKYGKVHDGQPEVK